MQLNKEHSSHLFIRHFEANKVRIGATEYSHSLILHKNEITPWEPKIFAEISDFHLQALMAQRPELIIIGTGATQQFFSPERTLPILKAGIGLELMTSSAACRTYNILSTEERDVLLALIV